MSSKRLSGFGTISWPERGVPTDKEAMAYLSARAGVFDEVSGPYEYLRGKWPQMSREAARRIQAMWTKQRYE